METFVVLAAGKGTRVGRVGKDLHKALLPLGDKAVISHIFDLAPKTAKLVVCVGDRSDQVIEYIRLAHPNHVVSFVHVDNEAPGNGPGQTTSRPSSTSSSLPRSLFFLTETDERTPSSLYTNRADLPIDLRYFLSSKPAFLNVFISELFALYTLTPK